MKFQILPGRDAGPVLEQEGVLLLAEWVPGLGGLLREIPELDTMFSGYWRPGDLWDAADKVARSLGGSLPPRPRGWWVAVGYRE